MFNGFGPSPDIDPIRSELEKDDRIASPFKSAYVAAKHGILGLTKTVALELAEHGITANAICPGYVLTPLVEKQIPETAKARMLTRSRSSTTCFCTHSRRTSSSRPRNSASSPCFSVRTAPSRSQAPRYPSRAGGQRSRFKAAACSCAGASASAHVVFLGVHFPRIENCKLASLRRNSDELSNRNTIDISKRTPGWAWSLR